MSETARVVIDRTMRDEQFLTDFQGDPDAALKGYDLTEQEREALKSGDETRIRDVTDDTIGEGLVGHPIFIYPPPQ